ncbi:hypothetical protein QBC39DRAFT_413415 [Podospora conica]|nr:hypothetical protein QBC39DRAFT_413415 [Schizothecium conicum]
MPPRDPAPHESIRSWFTTKTSKAALEGFRLPGHTDDEPGPTISEKDLHPTLPLNGKEPLDIQNDGHPQLIKSHYERVKLVALDGAGTFTAGERDGHPRDSFIDLASCNNCLRTCRNKKDLDAEEVVFSMRRLIAWTQTDPEAFLGPLANRKWWIAPSFYVLRIQQPGARKPGTGKPNAGETTPTNYIGDKILEEIAGLEKIYGDRDPTRDKADFQRAEVTVHLVQTGDPTTPGSHFSLLIHHRPTGNTMYMDSWHASVRARSTAARDEFKLWLENSGLPQPPPTAHHVERPVGPQTGQWTCGLHCIINALVFIRFGLFGWDQMPAWNKVKDSQGHVKDEDAIEALKKSLHHTLGVKYPLGKPQETTQNPKKIIQNPKKIIQKPTPAQPSAKPAIKIIIKEKPTQPSAAKPATQKLPKIIMKAKPTQPTAKPAPKHTPPTNHPPLPAKPPTEAPSNRPSTSEKMQALIQATLPGGTSNVAPTQAMLRPRSRSPSPDVPTQDTPPPRPRSRSPSPDVPTQDTPPSRPRSPSPSPDVPRQDTPPSRPRSRSPSPDVPRQDTPPPRPRSRPISPDWSDGHAPAASVPTPPAPAAANPKKRPRPDDMYDLAAATYEVLQAAKRQKLDATTSLAGDVGMNDAAYIDDDDDVDLVQAPHTQTQQRQQPVTPPPRPRPSDRTEMELYDNDDNDDGYDDDDDDYDPAASPNSLSSPVSQTKAAKRRRRTQERAQERAYRSDLLATGRTGAAAPPPPGPASAQAARVVGGLWDGRREGGVASRYRAPPRGVWRGGRGRGVSGWNPVVGRRRGGFLDW